MDNLGAFADQNFAKMLEKDLKESDDSNRQLKELSTVSANQLFGILGLADPGCDKDSNGKIKGDELKCLNYAWKAYLPHWSKYSNLNHNPQIYNQSLNQL